MLLLYREMERVAALVHNVSATFGRRDFLRRHMDKIEAMIADSGASSALKMRLKLLFFAPETL